ncbi:hypothetical protein GGTG_12115 [Gaeumannomyces tritici R3-111a-1]|uniref:DUF1275 domain-containing protein n=1 Tax=Gaeumannomyces tritici (strain R3-111a-1) TaxID=644352 RepID=J3PF36_GAET3|nr:hypothetical protein GGTG_12115 [Gaeumannomyces tritici R3-111a-1]EJT71094.1 hypothetical protein GGTG_12115 [Gaeumannomyces tritici R3-111a-1]
MSSANGYGTVAGARLPGAISGDEGQSLLRNGNGNSTPKKSVRQKLTVDVRRDWADLVLLFCYIITGLLDSSSISIWGSFVSMQTGNTVYIGLGLAAPSESTRWVKSLTSLGFFCIGSFFFSRFHRAFGPKKRWVLVTSFAVQAALCTAAAVILTFGPAAGAHDITWNVLVPIALIAFQSCGQAVTSRALKYNALTSVVLTSIYCDLFSDPALFGLYNAERNRRAAAPLLLLFGAFCGGLMAHSSFGIAGALWTAAMLKTFIVIAWFIWPSEPASEE